MKRHACALCPYVARRPSDIRTHVILRHTEPGRVPWIYCKMCSYRAKHASHMRRHEREQHLAEGEVRTLRCRHCDYVAKRPYRLKQHMVYKHTGDTGEWHACPESACSYGTMWSRYMVAHRRRQHGTSEAAQMEEKRSALLAAGAPLAEADRALLPTDIKLVALALATPGHKQGDAAALSTPADEPATGGRPQPLRRSARTAARRTKRPRSRSASDSEGDGSPAAGGGDEENRSTAGSRPHAGQAGESAGAKRAGLDDSAPVGFGQFACGRCGEMFCDCD